MDLKIHIIVLKYEKMEQKSKNVLHSLSHMEWGNDQKEEMMQNIYFIIAFDSLWHIAFFKNCECNHEKN